MVMTDCLYSRKVSDGRSHARHLHESLFHVGSMTPVARVEGQMNDAKAKYRRPVRGKPGLPDDFFDHTMRDRIVCQLYTTRDKRDKRRCSRHLPIWPRRTSVPLTGSTAAWDFPRTRVDVDCFLYSGVPA